MHRAIRTATNLLPAVVAAIAVAPLALGHDDDPKLRDRVPAYTGPGYRAAVDAAPPALEGTAFPAVGISLRSWVPLAEVGSPANGNDCWGYTAPSGREYALLGTSEGTAFIEVTDPDDPDVLVVHPGPVSIWRDVKTYQSWAYAVTEGEGAGIQVFDLSQIDQGTVPAPTVVNDGGVTDSHNVAIDETSGYLYRCGGGLGLRIYDLADPAQPLFVGAWDDRYVHDAQIVTYVGGPYDGRQIAFCCSGFNGGWVEPGIDIVDVTDKQDIQPLARYLYPSGVYSHQAWLSEDRRYLYLNDEEDEGEGLPTTTIVIDVADLENPFETARFTNGNAASGHNLYVRGDTIFESNYRSGLRVFDAADPLSPVEIAYFDTWPDSDSASFNGLWSNYPFFASGTVIGSDIEKGLFVWRLPVLELAIGFPAGEPEVIDPGGTVLLVQIDEASAGSLAPDGAMLHYDDGSGFVAVPLAPVGDGTHEASFPSFDCDTTVRWYVSAQASGGGAITSPVDAPATTYETRVALGVAVVFADDMEADPGWSTAIVDATTGQWQRGVPVDDPDWPYDPTEDGDGSGQAWLTQNETGNTDVDDGAVQLTSPPLDMSAPNVAMRYAYYLRLGEPGGFDRLRVQMSDSGPDGPWEIVAEHDDDGATWRFNEITSVQILAAGLQPTDAMRVRFVANDAPPGTIVEAGVDAIEIIEIDCTAPCPEDLDGSGIVGFGDLTQLLGTWGECTGCPEDLDGLGAVGFNDLTQLLAAWGPCP